MGILSEKEFLKAIKSDEKFSLCFIYGKDEFSKEICYKNLLKTVSSDVDISVCDGESISTDELYRECMSISFMSAYKCVIVKNPAIDSLSAQDLKELYSIIEQKPDSTLLIFISRNQEINTKKSAKWAKFIKTVSEYGVVLECAEKSRENVITMITNTAKKQNCTIDRELCGIIADNCLNDMSLIENELKKLCCYAVSKANGVITIDAIQALCAKQLDSKVFEITRHIIAKNASKALSILNSLFLQQVNAVSICAALSSAVLDIYRVKTMREYGKNPNELSSHYDYRGMDFKIRNAGFDADKCTLDFIKNAVLCLSQADILLKSSKEDKQTILESAIIKITRF